MVMMSDEQYENTLLGDLVHVKHVIETDVLNHHPSDEHRTFDLSTIIHFFTIRSQTMNNVWEKVSQKKKNNIADTLCSGNEEHCTDLITQSLKTGNHIFPLIQITKMYNSITYRVIYSSTCH